MKLSVELFCQSTRVLSRLFSTDVGTSVGFSSVGWSRRGGGGGGGQGNSPRCFSLAVASRSASCDQSLGGV